MSGRTVALTISDQSFFSFGLLTKLRWVAIIGQLFTILIVYYYLNFQLPLKLCLSVVGFSVFVNLLIGGYHGNSRRIPIKEIPYFLLYDLGQLTTLIFITGGLNNPFAVLILVPGIVAAGFLPNQNSLSLALATLFAIGILSLSPYPLPWHSTGLVLPGILQFGNAFALTTATVFLVLYLGQVASSSQKISKALEATQLALAREQRLASLGALAAAAAHELGTPLTTITLITKEMSDSSSLIPSQKEDLKAILEQVYRCRDILQDLARNFSGDKGLPFSEIPLTAAIDAVIHQLRCTHLVKITKDTSEGEPIIKLLPEFVHSLNNIISNAQQFANSQININCQWTRQNIIIIIRDDGPGFQKEILDQLGNPYVSSRLYDQSEYHLGLGLFIAQTLLEQLGGQLYFYNEDGAVCHISVPRQAIETIIKSE